MISTRRATRSWAAFVACMCLATLGLMPAGQASAASTARTWHVLVGAQSPGGAIQTMGFYPRHLWVDQGDSIVWADHSAEIHTVTFLAKGQQLMGPFNPGDPQQSTPQGTHTYDGHSYFNSGTLVDSPQKYQGQIALPPFVRLHRTYRLRFPDSLAPGTYHYLCLVHGMTMRGVIIVQRRGTPYPFSQAQIDQRAARQISSDLADGRALEASGQARARRLTREHGATVLVGLMDQRAMVGRFIPSNVTVRKGRAVRFIATSTDEPHTITFGSDVTGCEQAPCNPAAPWNVAQTRGGNLRADFPGHNGGFTGKGTHLNTGVMLGLPPKATGAPERLRLTATRTGTYHYSCALHDYFGMVGTLRVTR